MQYLCCIRLYVQIATGFAHRSCAAVPLCGGDDTVVSAWLERAGWSVSWRWQEQLGHFRRGSAPNSRTAPATGAGRRARLRLPASTFHQERTVLFIWGTLEHDHCSPADSGGLCVSGNTAVPALATTRPSLHSTLPVTTTNNQIMAYSPAGLSTRTPRDRRHAGADTRFTTMQASSFACLRNLLCVGSFHIAFSRMKSMPCWVARLWHRFNHLH